MMRALIDARHIVSLTLAGIVGVIGLHAWPWPTQDPILGLIYERRPDIYTGFRYAYSTLWVSTPLIAWNVVFSLLSIFVTRWHRTVTAQPLPPYPPPGRREDLFIVLAAVFPPCSLGGTTLTIRKFQTRFFTAAELVRIGTMTPGVLALLRVAINRNKNILISGGTSTGKTTLLNALAAFLPANDRVVLIEDTAELQIDRPNLVRFEARRKQANLPAVTIRKLLRATLRHRPDRIIVGEVRGGEAFDLLQALNTGHSGSLSTIHANSAQQALARFSSCVVQSGVELPYQAVRYQIADAIDLVLHLGRQRGTRVAQEIIRVERYDAQRDGYDTAALFNTVLAALDPVASRSGE